MDGTKIFALPDFAFFDEDGSPTVVDWKTGKALPGYDHQVLGYALYLADRYDLSLERMRAVIVYLNEGTEQIVPVSPDALDGFKSHFQRSVLGMRQLLSDPTTNTPRPQEHFPMTQDLSLCARCVFRRICGRQYALAQVA
jgi:CRISPR/Cas system-associated exonuclease Cas4 (RecB family)